MSISQVTESGSWRMASRSDRSSRPPSRPQPPRRTASYNIKELGVEAKEPTPFKSNFHGFMVSIGGRYAVSNTMGIVMYGFFAQAIKHMVNMYYQFGVCGVNGAWTYFKHEILNIKHRRSLIGGMASYRVPSYWILFLRMYLGVMWLIEGGNKILEGWLTDTTGGKVYWGPAPGAEGDAVAAASGAVTETVAEVVGGASVASASYAAPAVETVSAASDAVVETVTSASGYVTEVATEAVKQFAPPLLKEPLAIYTWINETFVAAAPYLFQVMIVLARSVWIVLPRRPVHLPRRSGLDRTFDHVPHRSARRKGRSSGTWRSRS